MAPNRMTAYQNARAAAKPQKGLYSSELLFDNLIGLDNEYLSAGERLRQDFSADEIGFLKNAGVSAYEGTKSAVMSPIETIQGVGDAIYNSGEDLLRGIDSKVQEMFGVSYDEATDEQVTQAREALLGDVLTVGSLAPGLGPAGKAGKGVGSLVKPRADSTAPSRGRELLLRERERIAQEVPPLTGDAAARAFETIAGDPHPLDRLPSLLERVQRGEPLTEEEAFDVMTYERHGEDGVYDPTNTFDNWSRGTGDTEGSARMAFLIDPENPRGLANPVARQPGPYFDDIPAEFLQPPPDVINIPDAPFLALEDAGPDFDIDDYDPALTTVGLTDYEVRPTIGQAEGIAGLYSPTRRAIDRLDRPSYNDRASLQEQLLNPARGAKPDELARLMAKFPEDLDGLGFDKEDLARMADEVSQDVVVSTRTRKNSPRDNEYFLNESYFLNGAEDIGANVFELNAGTQKVFGGGVPDTAFRHFKPSSDGRAPILHTRFGMFRSPGADKPDTYHLGEIQSDWAQTRQKLYPTRKEYNAATEKLLELDSKRDELENQRAPITKSVAGETGDEFDARVKRFRELSSEIARIDKERYELSGKMNDTTSYGTRDEYDEKFAAPYVGTTSKWVQLGLRQSLLDAVNKGAKRMTVSTGEQVKEYTFGKEGGQSKFYDEIVLKELDDVLKKFAKEAGIRKPEITTSKIVGSRRQEYTVPTVEFTDEFVEALKRVGLPAYAKGGIVKGSYLDNDPLEPALY